MNKEDFLIDGDYISLSKLMETKVTDIKCFVVQDEDERTLVISSIVFEDGSQLSVSTTGGDHQLSYLHAYNVGVPQLADEFLAQFDEEDDEDE